MPVELIVALVGVFGSVALVSGLLASRLLAKATTGQRRLRAQVAALGAGGSASPPGDSTIGTSLLPTETWTKLRRLVPKSPKDMSRLEKRMALAGYRKPEAAVFYALAEMACPILFGLLAFAVLRPAALLYWIVVGMAVVTGYFLPGLVLERKVAKRKKQIRNGLPDLLDLLIVCLDAGSGLDQAILKATEELQLAYPALAEEMRLVNVEMRAGKPRLEAFRNLAQRTKVDDLRSLVAMLVQTDRFGTSVSQALRVFANSLRTKRRQLAEERAAKIGVKLVFPLVLCLFPAFYVVTLGPAVIQFARIFFGPMMNGH